MEEIIIQYIERFGFPIFVVLWFMFRTEKILKQNTSAIENLSAALVKINLSYDNQNIKCNSKK